MQPLKEGAFKLNRLLKYGGRMPEYFYTRSSDFTLMRYFNLDLIVILPAILYTLLISN